MARSLVGGLVANDFPADNITVSDINQQQLSQLADEFAIQTTTDTPSAAEHADVIVLAVKPQILKQVATQISSQCQARKPLIVSIAAGIRSNNIDQWLGGEHAIVRCMPNTPALIQSGATALYANAAVNDTQRQIASRILQAAGITSWCDSETQLDAITALSGSGPAYFFLMIEAMQEAAIQLGLESEQALDFAIETALGAAKMAKVEDSSPAELRANVTSKGGTTAAAIDSFEQQGFRQCVQQAMQAAHDRSVELGDILGED